MTRKRLTPDEKDRIVELRLQHVPVRTIATQLQCSPNSVTKVYHDYLSQRLADRKGGSIDLALEEVLARVDHNLVDARRGYLRAVQAGDETAATRYLALELRALETQAKLGPERDDAPEQQARIAAAQATAVARVVRAAIGDAGLNADQSRVVLKAVATRIREIEQ